MRPLLCTAVRRVTTEQGIESAARGSRLASLLDGGLRVNAVNGARPPNRLEVFSRPRTSAQATVQPAAPVPHRRAGAWRPEGAEQRCVEADAAGERRETPRGANHAHGRYSVRSATTGSTAAARRAGSHVANRTTPTSTTTTAANTRGSVGLVWYSWPSISFDAQYHADQANHHSSHGKPDAAGEHEAQNGPAGRAERHANPDFLCALGDGVGRDAEDANRRQHQGDGCRQRQHHRDGRRGARRGQDVDLHGTKVTDGQPGGVRDRAVQVAAK